MGEIFLAKHGLSGFEKLCVIKKVITEKADRAKANRFLDEAKVVLRLSHSALVTTFDAGDVRGEFYIAMELVEGKDLREVWNRCVRTRQRILLDVALPGMSGADLLKRLRAEPATSAVPVVMLTGLEPPAGVHPDGILRKPFAPQDVRDTVLDWLGAAS